MPFYNPQLASSDKNNITDNYLPLPLVFFISVDIQKYKKKLQNTLL